MPKNQLASLALALTAAAGLISWACSAGSGGSSGTGGNSGSGGTSATGGRSGSGGVGDSCSNVMACGGDVVGTWKVVSSCLKVTGNLDLSLVGAGCPSAPVTGELSVTGTWTANADGTDSDDTTTSGTEQFTLAASCLVISSTPVTCSGAAGLLMSLGYSSLTCTSSADGGCSCAGTVQQAGGIGLVSPAPSINGNYTLSGSVVTISGDSSDTQYSYCSSVDTLTLTPQSTNPIIAGAVVLQKSSSGSGGTTGSGGTGVSSGGGGAVGSGGTTGKGGATGSGGSTGSGGTPGSGGAAGHGGTTGSGGSTGNAGTTGSGGSGAIMGPCDIYESGGTACVAAHSTVRALYGTYGGKLYQVRNAAGATKDILALTPGGFADGGSQDTFCSGTTCVITIVYDQSGKGNDLWYQGSTMVPGSTSSSPSKATSESLTLSGQKVYALYINAGNSYWVDASKSGIALGSQPEGMYLVTSGKHYNGGCCFDYGNSETDRKADGAGAMDALNFSAITAWGTGAGSGPWVMADLEYGVFAQNNTSKNQNDPTQTSAYVTAVLKNNGTTEYALRGGDATTGGLGTYYKGGLPGGWSPMKKQGAIVLGSGGDCCKPGGGANLSDGTFYEGCIVAGYPSDATEDAVQANVVAAEYGK
ncbi:MAG TPA: arabinofuranosidase catalytic domain-containing protein [Polyangia bacterium]|nr:arabinofuranosidase catalytic domain-containing protein [Polyangia bacterium]